MSSRQPSVTVVICVYQQREFLPWVLTALRAQDYQGSWEIVVCDDGSSEDMLSIVKQDAPTMPVRIRYIWQPDVGFTLSASRNNAIRCAVSDLLIFIDGDIVVPTDFVRQHVAAHDGKPRLVSGSRKYLFLSKYPDLYVPQLLAESRYDELSRYGKFPSSIFQDARAAGGDPWLGIIGCNFSVWRSQSVFFDESFVGWGVEDTEYAIRLWNRHGYSIDVQTSIGVYHLERTMPGLFDPCRPQTPKEIELYIKNIVRLTDLFPDLELEAIWRELLLFDYNSEDGRWLRASCHYKRDLNEVRATALAWVDGQRSLAS